MKIRYRTYPFSDHDPVLDRVNTAWSDGGDMSIAELSRLTGVSKGTLYKYRNYGVRYPRFATVAAVISACGGNLDDILPKRRTVSRQAVRRRQGVSGAELRA